MECMINEASIYYQEFGQGTPILCIHGFPLDHQVMAGCIEPILESSKNYKRIYLDLPGMGKSPSQTGIKNADDMLNVVKEFINKVIGTQGFLLAGLSYGGYLSLGLASDSNINIDGIFLICPCVISDHTQRKLPTKQMADLDQLLADELMTDGDFKDFMDYAVVADTSTWLRYKNEILPGLKAADTNFIDFYQKSGYGFSFETKLCKLHFHKPVYILTGKQDNCVGYEDTWELTKDMPHVTFITLDGAGHNLQIEKPDFFKLYFCDWLHTIENHRIE